MTKTLSAAGTFLHADKEARTISYVLLPFGEEGATSAGKITASAGAVALPEDVTSLELNLEHDYTKPVGRFVRVEETDSGIEATVKLAATTAGDDALTLAAEGLRTGISVEIADPVIRAGQLIAGRLTGAGLVVRPAFANARMIAADCGETNEKESAMPDNQNLEAAEVVASVEQPAPLHAGAEKVELGALTFNAAKNGESVQAALADLKTTDDAGKVFIKDQEVGELWEARKTERRIVEAVGVKPLSSLFVTGTRKARTFKVADWAGNKVELPTGKFTTSRENWQAKAKAVAVDVAMELIEFGSEDVISDLYEQAVESYVEQTESEMIELLALEGTAVAGAAGALDAVSKAAATLGAMGARMSLIAVSPDVYAALTEIKGADAPWWLQNQGSVNIGGQSANISGLTLTSDANLDAGTVIVADSRAIDYRESKEFRFRAIDLPKGGVDISLIKFNASKVTDPGAILVFSGVGGVEA